MTNNLITNFETFEPSSPATFDLATGEGKEDCLNIVQELKDFLQANLTCIAISAPQLGINKRIFCIKFNDQIKTFINPIIIKKSHFSILPETCISFPEKEILLARPSEITIVYYTDEFKYEENKLLDQAARLFDQQIQFLDGVTPIEIGLVSEPAIDGSLFELSDTEIREVQEYYKQFISKKLKAYETNLQDSEEQKVYTNLKFTEAVINGRAQIVADPKEKDKKDIPLISAFDKKIDNANKRASLKAFLRRK